MGQQVRQVSPKQKFDVQNELKTFKGVFSKHWKT
jgi:hypothetical protein